MTSTVVHFLTTRTMIEAGISAAKTELMEELKFNRAETIRFMEKEEWELEVFWRERLEYIFTSEERLVRERGASGA